MSMLAGHRAGRRKRQRLMMATGALALLGAAAFLVFNALDETLLYFRLPVDVVEQKLPAGERFRLGGLVAGGSVVQDGEDADVSFAVTDGEATLDVRYRGILPDLFREGQGVIAEGALDADGIFRADSVLAKHDETYMPKEVYESLRARGHPAEPGAGS